jgi:twitching motility protein PilT
MDFKELLQLSIDKQASDLHIVSGYYPTIRIHGELYQLKNYPVVTPEMAQSMLLSILNDQQKENLLANKETDLGYEYNGYRFRANIYFAKNSVSGSFRLIPLKIKTLQELSLPQQLDRCVDFNQGLVLVTGPTGEGKSSTLAAIISEINIKYSKHILTIEDPVEYVYPAARSIISQRQMHQDTHSWSIALRSALREDPDVILIGEMRDYETIELAMTAAETGHLVFSTLHTVSAPDTINRIIDVFPPNQQNQMRTQLSTVLQMVITQRLMPRMDVVGRIPAVEVLYNNSAVASIIRDGKPHLLNNVLLTGEAEGFVIFEKYLASLYSAGRISRDTAFSFAIRPKELEKLIT